MGALSIMYPSARIFEVYLGGFRDLHYANDARWQLVYVGFQPVDCVVKNWTDIPWGQCSRTCGGGAQYRIRTPVVDQGLGGASCPSLSQKRMCAPNHCPETDCKVRRCTREEMHTPCTHSYIHDTHTLIHALYTHSYTLIHTRYTHTPTYTIHTLIHTHTYTIHTHSYIHYRWPRGPFGARVHARASHRVRGAVVGAVEAATSVVTAAVVVAAGKVGIWMLSVGFWCR
jgi:hypothetical protein